MEGFPKKNHWMGRETIFQILLFLLLFPGDKICFADLPKNSFIGKQEERKESSFSDRWWAVDKYRHFIAAAFITGVGYNIARVEGTLPRSQAIWLGTTFSLSLGLVKEIRDRFQPGNRFSWKDLLADLAGITLGVLCFTEQWRY